MIISLNKKKRVKLKFNTFLAKCDFETLESGEVQEIVYDLITFEFSMPVANLEYSNKPELKNKFSNLQKRMNWAYGVRIKQDAQLEEKFKAIHTGIDKVCKILEQIGFIITDEQVCELNREISRKFIELYGDRE